MSISSKKGPEWQRGTLEHLARENARLRRQIERARDRVAEVLTDPDVGYEAWHVARELKDLLSEDASDAIETQDSET